MSIELINIIIDSGWPVKRANEILVERGAWRMGIQDMVFVEIAIAFLMYGDSCVGKYSIDKCREIDLISVQDTKI